MDTSIVVVIAIIVVFLVAVPTMIRRSATELSRVDVDTVPEDARVIVAEQQSPCLEEEARARVFHSDTAVKPSVPRKDAAVRSETPALSLSARTPEFAVIDGCAESSAADPAEAVPDSRHEALPMAVGQSAFRITTSSDDSHHWGGPADAGPTASAEIRTLHPAVREVFNQTGDSNTGGSSRSGDHRSGTFAAAGSDRVSPAVPIHAGSRQSRMGSTGGDDSRMRGTDAVGREHQGSTPLFRADEEYSMTEKETQLRESLGALGSMVRGFALVFLGSVLGILVTGVLAIFSVVHPALIGVFVGLGVVSLLMVRTLNLRKRDIRAEIRTLDRAPRTKRAAGAPAPAMKAKTAGSEKTAAVTEAKTGPKLVARQSALAEPSRARPATKPAQATTKAAQARAAMQRSAAARAAREEADTGEIPIVHIRNEAAAGHTTRQVLLTGPIPIVEDENDTIDDKTSTTSAKDGAGAEADLSTTAPETVSAATVTSFSGTGPAITDAAGAAHEAAERTADQGIDEAGTDAVDEADADAVGGSEAAEVSDPFQQRLLARDAWSPTPLPVPSYVDAPEAEHMSPTTRDADATSYLIESRSREDIAAQFAAELGYRPELSDSAREDGPLGHGRKAIRTSKAPELSVLDDVLARRRA